MKLYTTEQAAKTIGVSLMTVHRAIKRQPIPCYRAGRYTLFDDTQLIKLREIVKKG